MDNDFVFVESVSDLSDEEIVELYRSVKWSAYTEKPDMLLTGIRNSDFVVTCRCKGRLVGLARSLSDDAHIHYLQDLLIEPAYQRRGLGSELVARCFKRFAHVRAHVLLTDDRVEQRQFYESLGFRNTQELHKHRMNVYVKFRDIILE
jgi:GNAT superfamily N-acetyltransferase